MMLCMLFLSLFIQDTVKDYSEAQKLSLKENKPLVVIITADWCIHCPRLKAALRKRFSRSREVFYTEVSLTDNPDLATKIMVEGDLPQTAIFYMENGKSMKKMFHGGGEDTSKIDKFLEIFKRE